MTEQLPFTTTPLPYRLTVEDFFRLDAAGAFAGHGKTELIRGEVFYMNAQHRPHARAKGLLYIELVRGLSGLQNGLEVLIEATVAMTPSTAPEPDLVVTSEAVGEGPVPLLSVRLIVEIADTTQANDLRNKAGVYAENDVPEYWVVDLKEKLVHQMWSPAAGSYGNATQVAFGERVEAATIAGLGLKTEGLS